MKTNEKKSYQFYFKKLETPTTSKDNKKSQGLQTSPYIKYDMNEKLRLSSNVQSGNKSIQDDRGSQTYGLQNKAWLYSSGYTPGKLSSNRQHYMFGDTSQKYIPKYITPKNTQLTPEGNKQQEKQKVVKQFNPPQQIPMRTIAANQQQHAYRISAQNSKIRSQSCGLNNQGRLIQRREQQMDEKALESGDVESRNAKMTDFINSTMGNSAILWNDIKLRKSIQSYFGPQQMGKSITSSNNNTKTEDFYAGIERLKHDIRQQEMKTSTLLGGDDNSTVQCQVEKSVGIPHVESKMFLNDTPLLNSKVSYECRKCDDFTQILSQSHRELQQLQFKRHHAMQQVYKQYNIIKDHQQNQIKLKHQLQSKTQQANQHKITISTLQKTILLMNDMNQKSSLQIKSLQRLKQDEINQLTGRYEQLLRKQRENIGNCMSCIARLNQKIEDMDGDFVRLQKELTDKYQSKIKQIEQSGVREVEMVRQQMVEQMQRVKQSYESRINGVQCEYSAKLTALQQSHFLQISKLSSQLQDTKTYSQQVPYLTDILVKLQSQLFLSITQKDTLFNQNQSLSNQLIRLSQTIQSKQQQLKLLRENIGQLASENQHKDRQLQRVILQLQGQRVIKREMKLSLVHEQEWLSISPSTSSIKQQVVVTPTVKKEVVVIEQLTTTKQAVNNQQKQLSLDNVQKQLQQNNIIDQKTFTQLNTKFLELQTDNSNLIQQLQITSSQLDANVDRMSQMDESLARYSGQIQKLQQTIKNCQSQIQSKDNIINQSKQIIVELNDKVIVLKKKLYPSDQIISCSQGMEEEESVKHQGEQITTEHGQDGEHDHEHSADVDMIACLTQQLQQKQQQITELQQQLQQSFDIINLLKNQLTNNKVQQPQNYIHSQQQHHPSPMQQQHQMQLQHSSPIQQRKQILLNEYFVKIQDYYNQILQIFGLELINHNELQLENIASSRKGEEFVGKFQIGNNIDGEQQGGIRKQQVNIDIESSSIKRESLTMFQHQNAVESQSTLIQIEQSNKSPQQSLHSPSQPHPLSQAFLLLSQNQQQVLKIINQWIRKMQRQSSVIRQYKQKCHLLQQHIALLKQDNSQLSLQKVEIYDKYESFFGKLQVENNEQQEKMHMLGEKIVEMERYVKELEEVIHQTNRECMIGGLVALELRREHSTFGRFIQKSLFAYQQSSDAIEKSQLKQSDVEQFYSQHQLAKIASSQNDQPPQLSNKPVSCKDLTKSQANLSEKQQALYTQNEQQQVAQQMKIQPLDSVSNIDHSTNINQVIINNQ